MTNRLGESSGATCFVDDEAGYAGWLRAHVAGYVLNCHRQPQASYLVLHRATCHTISGIPARGLSWTVDYAKVCSDSATSLSAWALEKTKGSVSRCGVCSP